MSTAMDDVIAERERQNQKWGEQNHSPMQWLPILMEEVGEASQRAVQAYFGGARDGQRVHDERQAQYREEMVQVAAVAVAMIECFDRNAKGGR